MDLYKYIPSLILLSVSLENFGSISMLTNPSLPPLFSYTGNKILHASEISLIDSF